MNPLSAILVCLFSVALLLVAERRGAVLARAVTKTIASLAFVLTAWLAGAGGSVYGVLVLAALGFSVLGDVLLLSHRSGFFLAGLAAFLAAHAVYAAAFVHAGVAGGATLGAAAVALLAGALILRWLWPHLQARNAPFRGPVLAYVVVILAMCTLAVGCSVRHGSLWAAAGALLFALSDIAVARERFVAPGFVNRAWGLPAYYVAQLMLAGTVGPG